MKDTVRTATLVSEQERARRKANIDYARGSVRYEGHILCDEMEALIQRHTNGELTVAEFTKAGRELIDRK